ncbi:hypothetical protein JIN77_02345 [Verrucomicrobiaceae bacterium R5-34]|nr:hypothetical protein [Verrucomicrobiaceae bacterium R5-34]
MKSKHLFIPAAWVLSLSIAYIVGAKIQSSNDSDKNDTADVPENARSYYRSSASNASSSRRGNAGRDGASGRGLSKEDLDISNIVKDDDPIQRVQSLLALIGRLGPNDFEQVVADFRASGLTRERMAEYEMLLHAWAKSDPLSALAYAEENTGSRFARQTILSSWAADNPTGALQWAESHYDGDGANPWLVGVIRGVVKTDPAQATEIMGTLPYSRERGDALATIIPHIAELGQEQAQQWLNTLDDERLRNGATARLAESLAEKDPEATASWVMSLSDEEQRQRAIGEVADTWADNDVASAVAWTETLSGADKVRAASELIGEYTQESPEEASQWLDSMAGTDGYDSVARSFIWSSARSNPELALSKVSTLNNAENQPRYYSRVLNEWHRRDADAAAAWMDSNNVSEAIRNNATRTRRGR